MKLLKIFYYSESIFQKIQNSYTSFLLFKIDKFFTTYMILYHIGNFNKITKLSVNNQIKKGK